MAVQTPCTLVGDSIFVCLPSYSENSRFACSLSTRDNTTMPTRQRKDWGISCAAELHSIEWSTLFSVLSVICMRAIKMGIYIYRYVRNMWTHCLRTRSFNTGSDVEKGTMRLSCASHRFVHCWHNVWKTINHTIYSHFLFRFNFVFKCTLNEKKNLSRKLSNYNIVNSYTN